MKLPIYPDSEPISFELKNEISKRLLEANRGISEFTFANLFLFRNHYSYRVSDYQYKDGSKTLLILGKEPEGNPQKCFVMLPEPLKDMHLINTLLEEYCYIKNVDEDWAETHRIELESHGFCVEQDRNNFDYLYSRKDLADLQGKKFHKKRNLVNAFINNYAYEEKRIDPAHKEDLYTILTAWLAERESGDSGDYAAAYEAIEHMEELGLRGCLTYVDGKPSAYSMGESIAQGEQFAIHFEKAHGNYKGIYQFINKSFAAMMPSGIIMINREQDLGDPGLRQAKMSYRPTGYIKKYRITPSEFGPCGNTSEEQEDLNHL